MTLALGITTSSGIVLTADSRQTYRNAASMMRVGSDNAMKLFQLSDRMGVAIAGRAFLQDTNGASKSTGWFIEEFKKKEMKPDLETKEVAQKLHDYLTGVFVDKAVISLEQTIRDAVAKEGGTELNMKARNGNTIAYTFNGKDGVAVERIGNFDNINLVIAGIDKDKIGRTYRVVVPGDVTSSGDTNLGGATWIGQTDVLGRIVKGWAPELDRLTFVNDAITKNKPDVQVQLNKLEYIINYGSMALQDAVDFGILITRTTESIQRFSDGTFLFPGGIPGVGGEIDVAVITPEKGFVWLKKKELKAGEDSIDLDLEQSIPTA